MNKLWLLGLLVGMAGLQACQQNRELPRFTWADMSDEEQIAAVLQQVQHGLERRRTELLLPYISQEYRDEAGRDYEAIHELLIKQLRNYREIRITRMPPRILVEGDNAQVIETLGASAQPADPLDISPIDLQGNITVYLERFAHTWQITGYRTSS